MTDRRKQSLYFPEHMLREIEDEAVRLDRSMSWVVQFAWAYGPEKLRALPTIPQSQRVPT